MLLQRQFPGGDKFALIALETLDIFDLLGCGPLAWRRVILGIERILDNYVLTYLIREVTSKQMSLNIPITCICNGCR